jgi:hypothetical protein
VTAHASAGTVTILGPDNTSASNATLGGSGTISAQCLTVLSEANAAPVSLVTNVSNLVGSTNQSLTIRNTGDLTIGSTGGVGTLAVNGSIDVQTSGNLTTAATLSAPARSSIFLTSTAGNVVLGSLVQASNAPVRVVASGGSIRTPAGQIVIASGDIVKVMRRGVEARHGRRIQIVGILAQQGGDTLRQRGNQGFGQGALAGARAAGDGDQYGHGRLIHPDAAGCKP